MRKGGKTATFICKEIIENPDIRAKFLSLLQTQLDAKTTGKASQYLVIQVKFVDFREKKYLFTLNAFAPTGKITLQTSERIPEELFNDVSKHVSKLVELSKQIMSISLPENPLVQMSRRINSYIEGLRLDDDIERMIAVILLDIMIDSLLSVKLLTLNIPLVERGIPEKLEKIREKESVEVLNASEIRQLRSLRNDVIHKARVPTRNETEWALGLIKDLISKL